MGFKQKVAAGSGSGLNPSEQRLIEEWVNNEVTYYGDPDNPVEGDIRIIKTGTVLFGSRYEAGAWVQKSAIVSDSIYTDRFVCEGFLQGLFSGEDSMVRLSTLTPKTFVHGDTDYNLILTGVGDIVYVEGDGTLEYSIPQPDDSQELITDKMEFWTDPSAYEKVVQSKFKFGAATMAQVATMPVVKMRWTAYTEANEQGTKLHESCSKFNYDEGIGNCELDIATGIFPIEKPLYLKDFEGDRVWYTIYTSEVLTYKGVYVTDTPTDTFYPYNEQWDYNGVGKVVTTYEENGDLITKKDLYVAGNMVIDGTISSQPVENLRVKDNHIRLNDGYTLEVAKSSGLSSVYLPLAKKDTVTGGNFTAGVDGVSNPTVTTDSASVFLEKEYVQIVNEGNTGVFEVLSHTGNVLTIKGVGIVSNVTPLVETQFNTETGVSATIQHVTITVLCSGTTGEWEVAKGNTTDQIDPKLLIKAGDNISLLTNNSGFETPTELNARDTANRNRANHTGTQTASTISDFDTEVSNNPDVTDNTAHRNSDGKNHSDVALNNTHRGIVTGNPHAVTKAEVGLGNADNTSDADKPISDATQTALDNKKDDFTENTGFNKDFGSTAGTAAQGNDSRFTDDRNPTNHASNHTDGTDDIQDATASQKGLMTATQASKLNGIEAGAEVNNVSDTDATDLTDGGETTLHYHDSDRDRANHTGTQAISTVDGLQSELDSKALKSNVLGYVLATWGANLQSVGKHPAINGAANTPEISSLGISASAEVPAAGTIDTITYYNATGDNTTTFQIIKNGVVMYTFTCVGPYGVETGISVPTGFVGNTADNIAIRYASGTAPGEGFYSMYIN